MTVNPGLPLAEQWSHTWLVSRLSHLYSRPRVAAQWISSLYTRHVYPLLKGDAPPSRTAQSVYPGLVLIAKVGVNLTFFKCCTYFSHIAVSPCSKELNTDWKVMACWWLPSHWTLDLLANSVSFKLWLRTPHWHALQVKSIKGRMWTTK